MSAIASDAASVVPGPRNMPIVGWRGLYYRFMHDPIKHSSWLHRQFGPLISIPGSPASEASTICGFGEVYNQQVFSQPDQFYHRAIGIRAPEGSALWRLGRGLLNGDKHKRQRRLLMPAFHKKAIEGYYDTMVSITQQVADQWQVGQVIDAAVEMTKITANVTVKTLFGLDDPEEVRQFSGMFDRWMKLNVAAGLLPIDHPRLPYGRLMKLSDDLDHKIRDIIVRKRKNLGASHDIVSTLIDARDEDGSTMSDDELVSETNILFAAGHETSWNVLTWTLFLLAQHPSIAAALLDELKATLHGNPPGLEHLNQLPMLDRVIKESMRLFPPGTYTTRKAVEPFAMGGYEFKAGTNVVLSNYLTHRIADSFRDAQPQRFMPERWEHCNPSSYEYIPFGAGPRMCIGSSFAIMELKIVLAMLLQRFRLSIVPNARIDRKETTTLTPKHGLPMVVFPQDGNFTRSPIRGNIHEMVDLHD
jgi:cytochrome P450